MKKVLFLVVMFIFPLIVFADGAGPYVKEYEVYVSNPAGAKAYDYNGKETGEVFPVDTTFKVYMEEIINGVYYVDVMYKDDYYLCKSSDLSLKKDFAIPDEDTWRSETPIKLYTYTNGGYLYKGPSKKYDKVMSSEIPVGTILTYEYETYGWAYVTYNNEKGWVFIYQKDDRSNPYDDNTSFAKLTDETVFTLPGTSLLDDNGKEIEKINDFTEVRINYYLGYLNAWPGATQYNVNYKGKVGWIYATAEKNDNDDTLYFFKDVDLFETTNSKKKIGTIPKNTEIKYDYYVNNYQDAPTYYLTYNGKTGSISDYDNVLYNHLVDSYDKDYKYVIYDSVDVYDKPFGKVIDKAVAGNEMQIKYHYYAEEDEDGDWLYVISSDYEGWICLESTEILKQIENGKETDIDESDWEAPTYDDDYWDEYFREDYEKGDSDSLLDDENTVLNTGLSPIELTLCCVGGAFILAVTAFVVIKLINKKKKSKEVPSKEEPQITEEAPKEDNNAS